VAGIRLIKSNSDGCSRIAAGHRGRYSHRREDWIVDRRVSRLWSKRAVGVRQESSTTLTVLRSAGWFALEGRATSNGRRWKHVAGSRISLISSYYSGTLPTLRPDTRFSTDPKWDYAFSALAFLLLANSSGVRSPSAMRSLSVAFDAPSFDDRLSVGQS
jgi:hypothetical protein